MPETPTNPTARDLEPGVMLDLYWRIIRNANPEEGARLNVAYAIARCMGLDCPAAKVIVPATVPSGFANEHFGESYGVDWEYEPAA